MGAVRHGHLTVRRAGGPRVYPARRSASGILAWLEPSAITWTPVPAHLRARIVWDD